MVKIKYGEKIEKIWRKNMVIIKTREKIDLQLNEVDMKLHGEKIKIYMEYY